MSFQPAPAEYVKLKNVTLAYYDSGEKHLPALLFIHGLAENRHTWAKIKAHFLHKYRIIGIDLPGHGQSSGGDMPYTPYFFADVVAEFIKVLGLQQLSLVGHSLGGQIAVILCLSHPALINKLVLIAPAGFENFSESDKRWMMSNMSQYNTLQFSSLMASLPMAFPSQAVYQATVKGMLEQPVFQHLHLMRQPTLILFGEEDGLIPNKFLHPKLSTRSVAEAGAREMPNSKLVIIKNAGHFLHIEHARKVNGEMEGFL